MNLSKPIAAAILLFCSLQTQAQLDSCNVFLQGFYVEVGINFNGAYGSSVPPPVTGYCGTPYHPKGANNVYNSDGAVTSGSCPSVSCSGGDIGLGFVADPDKDGWTVGSPHSYYGDYFLPGTPQEGWSIESDGIQADNFNGPGCSSSICGICVINDAYGNTGSGNNISYSTSGTIITAVWQGTWDSLLITQTTTLDTSMTFFVTNVTIKNTGTIVRHGVYYQRTVDPDNAEPETGNFTTFNKIEYQLPDTANKVLVSSWGLDGSGTVIPSAYLGLGTMDSNAKCYISLTSGLYPPAGEKMDSLWGAYASHSSIPGGGDTVNLLMRHDTTYTNDVSIGLVFKVGDLLPTDTVKIAYAYAFKKGADLDSALKLTSHPSHTDTSGDTTHHTGINTVKNNENCISVYPNPLKNEMTISGLSITDQITIFDMMGRKMETWIIAKDGNNTFNTTTLPTGVYIIRVLDKNGNVKAKLPIQKI